MADFLDKTEEIVGNQSQESNKIWQPPGGQSITACIRRKNRRSRSDCYWHLHNRSHHIKNMFRTLTHLIHGIEYFAWIFPFLWFGRAGSHRVEAVSF